MDCSAVSDACGCLGSFGNSDRHPASASRRHAASLAILRHDRLPGPLANDGHDTRALQHYLGHKNIQHGLNLSQLSTE